jgi:hypothetical protein
MEEKCSFLVFSEMLSPAKPEVTSNPPSATVAARVRTLIIYHPSDHAFVTALAVRG